MKILVTGGGGYLGSILVPLLLDKKHTVTVIDTFTHGVPSLAGYMWNPLLTVLREDARSSIALDLVPKHDAILPLAALVGVTACDRDPLTAHTLNREAVLDVIKVAHPDQLIIYPCTNSGYGLGGEVECTEDSPLNPISLYGETKVEAERAVLQHPMGVSLRLATLFGCSPRMRTDLLVNDFVYRAVHDRAVVLFEPTFRRNFLHVRDAANAFLFAIHHYTRMVGLAHNVGDSRINLTKLDLIGQIKRELPEFTWSIAQHGSDPDKRDYIVSNARIESLGWVPQFTLQDGIKELVHTYRGMPYERSTWRN